MNEKRVMVIIWKWEKSNNPDEQKKYLRMMESVDYDFIKVIKETDKINNNDYIFRIIDSKYCTNKITKKIEQETSNYDKKLVLFHKANSVTYNIKNLENKYGKYNGFSGGVGSDSGFIYNEEFGLIDDDGDFREKSYIQEKGVKQFNFNSVWDHYFKNLKQKKNELIKLWLPLVIDIQGLSEINNKAIRKDYLEEIDKDYYKEVKERHNRIICDIDELADYMITNGHQISNLIDSISSGNIIDDRFLDPKKEFFFPNFLNDIKNKFNQLIINEKTKR